MSARSASKTVRARFALSLSLTVAASLGGFALVKRQVEAFRQAAAPFERLTGRRVEAAGGRVGELFGRRGLRRLDLSGSGLNDAELLDLQPALESLPNLDELALRRSRVSGAGLAALGNLRQLHGLDLLGSPVSDDGLEQLRPLLRLSRLGLAETRVTDAGLRHLEPFENLQILWLGRTKITDACIPHLGRLKQLALLSLEQTEISDAGLRRLQEALPDCEIIR